MINGKKSKIVASLVLFMVGGLCMLFILDFVAIGPGLPPPAGMPGWYIPNWDTRVIQMENGTLTLIEDRSVAEHFEMLGDRIIGENPSCFPEISQYCGYAKCARTMSDDRYLIAAWYFDDGKKFSQAQNELYQYLEEHGRVSAM